MHSSRLLISLIFLAYYSLNVNGSNYCHYTCLNCTEESYTSCLSCFQKQISYWPLNSQQKTGLCTQPIQGNINILGFVMLFTLIIFCCIIKGQFIFYVFFYFQTCGTLFFLEANWTFLLNYLLAAFTYLMPVATISSHIKRQKEAIETYYKQGQYFKSVNFFANLAFLGTINAFLMILMMIIPLFKLFRNRFISERSSVISDSALNTLLKIIKILFLLLIQQTSLSLFYSISNNRAPFKSSQVVIIVIYFLFLTFYFIYHCFQILPIFRTKMSQILIIISRIITPIFILLDKKYHFICPILAIFFFFWEVISNSKNKQNRKLNTRLLLYKFVGLIILGLFLILYFLEIRLNNQTLSNVAGNILFSITIISINIIYLEAFVQTKIQCCEKYLSASNTTKISFEFSQEINPKKIYQSSQTINSKKPSFNFTHQTEEIIDFPQIVNITFEDVLQLQPNHPYKQKKQSMIETKRAKTIVHQQQHIDEPQKREKIQEIREQLKEQMDQVFIFAFKQLIEDSTQQ